MDAAAVAAYCHHAGLMEAYGACERKVARATVFNRIASDELVQAVSTLEEVVES